MKVLVLVAFASVSLGMALAIGAPYHAPPHNYYQNNWMNGG